MQTLQLPFNLADYVLPAALLAVAVLGLVCRVPLFDSFVKGAGKALRVVAGIFPYLAAVFLCVALLEASGLGDKLCARLSPVLTGLGVPVETLPLLLVKPLSGSGSLAVLTHLVEAYGADSPVARTAAVMAGSSETVLYVAAVYFGASGIKRLRYGLGVAFACTLFGALASCWIASALWT